MKKFILQITTLFLLFIGVDVRAQVSSIANELAAWNNWTNNTVVYNDSYSRLDAGYDDRDARFIRDYGGKVAKERYFFSAEQFDAGYKEIRLQEKYSFGTDMTGVVNRFNTNRVDLANMIGYLFPSSYDKSVFYYSDTDYQTFVFPNGIDNEERGGMDNWAIFGKYTNAAGGTSDRKWFGYKGPGVDKSDLEKLRPTYSTRFFLNATDNTATHTDYNGGLKIDFSSISGAPGLNRPSRIFHVRAAIGMPYNRGNNNGGGARVWQHLRNEGIGGLAPVEFMQLVVFQQSNIQLTNFPTDKCIGDSYSFRVRDFLGVSSGIYGYRNETNAAGQQFLTATVNGSTVDVDAVIQANVAQNYTIQVTLRFDKGHVWNIPARTFTVRDDDSVEGPPQDACKNSGQFTISGWQNGESYTIIEKPAASRSALVNTSGRMNTNLNDVLPGDYKFRQYVNCVEYFHNVEIKTKPTVSATNSRIEVCFGGTTNLYDNIAQNYNSNMDFTWSEGSGSVFDATGLAADDYTVTAVYTGTNGCGDQTTFTVRVLSEATIQGSVSKDICVDIAGTINLTDELGLIGSGTTGSLTWNGPGALVASNGDLTPGDLTAGNTYELTVTGTTGAGCAIDQSVFISGVNPSVETETYQVCNTDPLFELSDYRGTWDWDSTNPSAGNPLSVSGSGSSQTTFFSAQLATANSTYSITATDLTTCKTYEYTFVVPQDPGLTLTITETNFCPNDPPINLLSKASEQTNINFFWGGGSGFEFDPSDHAGTTVTINAVYTNAQGCQFTASDVVTIAPNITVNGGSNEIVCENRGDVFLGSIFTGATSSSGTGVWSTNEAGVTVTSNQINTNNLTVGRTYTFLYSVTSGSCTFSDEVDLTVVAKPDVSAGLDFTVCKNAGVQDLDTDGDWQVNIGGSLQDIPSKQFDPNAMGAGVYTFTKSKTNGNGCTFTDDVIITIEDPDGLDIGDDVSICYNAQPLNLISEISLDNRVGTFSVAPETEALEQTGFFDPTKAAPNTTYTITYTIEAGATEGKCFATDSRDITVTELPELWLGGDMQICKGDPLTRVDLNDQIDGVDSDLMEYSGTGIVRQTNGGDDEYYFDQTGLSAGNYVVTGSYGNGDCANTMTKTIRLTSLPQVAAGPDLFLCEASPVINMTDGSPQGGEYYMAPADNAYGAAISDRTRLNPSLLDPNKTYTLVYEYQDENGCVNTALRQVTVDAEITFDITFPDGEDKFVFCEGDNTFDLSPYIKPFSGGIGTFDGIGISGTSFNPKQGPGNYNITYQWENQYGCSADTSFYVNVQNKPTDVFAGNKASLCYGAPLYDLTLAASHADGVFTGPAVVYDESDGKYYFDAVIAGAGTTTVFYTVTNTAGCATTVEREIEVKPLVEISAGPNLTVCETSGFIDLNVGVEGTGTKTWTGPQVNESIVDPADLPIGIHKYTLSILQGNGCTATDTKTINIIGEPVISGISGDLIVCDQDGLIGLNEELDQEFKTTVWEGLGVVNDSNFDPSIVGEGTVTLTGTYVSPYNCESTITRDVVIKKSPAVTVGGPITTCSTAPPIPLEDIGSPKNGQWDGPGIIDGAFWPTKLGAGNYELYYSIESAQGCTSTATKFITVTNPAPISAGPSRITCVNSEDIFLDEDASIEGATWSGIGVTLNIFSPSDAGVGEHQIQMTYDYGQGCTATAYKVIKVTEPLTVDAGPNIEVCRGQGMISLSKDVSISGGFFEGPYTSGTSFNTDDAIAGTYELEYFVENNNGCNASDFLTVTVVKNPVITVGPQIEVCNTADSIEVRGFFNPVGGDISSPYVVGDYFRPNGLAPGDYEILYSISNEEGCFSQKSKFITIVEPDPVDAGPNIVSCLSLGSINMEEGSSVSGAKWFATDPSLQDAISLSYWDPAVSGVGTFEVEMVQDFGGGCISRDKKSIKIEPDLTVNPGDDMVFCQDQGLKNIESGLDKPGGIWVGNNVTEDGSFDTNILPGDYTITYVLTNETSGCSAEGSKTVTILPKPAISVGQAVNVCNTNPNRIDLNTIVLTDDVNYSGPGIEDGHFFNGFGFLPGDYDIRVTKTSGDGCYAETYKRITVYQPDEIVTEELILCEDSDPVFLEPYADMRGSVFNGTGVFENVFYPDSVPNTGNYNIDVSFDNGSGCMSYGRMYINVREKMKLDMSVDTLSLCKNAEAYNLNTFVSSLGGVWNGVNVTADGVFDPATATSGGTYKAFYTLENQFSCTVTDSLLVIVSQRPTPITTGSDVIICNTDTTPLDLTTYIKPLGVQMDGLGIEDDTFFNAEGLQAGEYTINLYYENEAGCSVSGTKTITVQDPPELFSEDLVICSNALPLGLDSYPNLRGTEISGAGVYDNYFYADSVETGNYTLQLVNDQGNGCVSQGSMLVTVRQPTEVIILEDSLQFCSGETTPFDLNTLVNRRGGYWTGAFTDGTFTPNDLRADRTYSATYNFEDEFSCLDSDEIFITINEIPAVNPGVDKIECYLGQDIALFDGTQFPTGGWFEGRGVVNQMTLETSSLGAGEHTVEYHYYDDATGCSNFEERTITLVPPPFFTVGASKSLCISSPGFDMNEDISDSTIVGEWSGDGIVGSLFEPQLAGIGQTRLEFVAQTVGGCVITKERFITVVEEPSLEFTNGLTICQEEGGENLSNHVNIPGGQWSSSSGFVEGSIFNPTDADPGYYTVNYFVPSYLGCSLTGSLSVRVVQSDSVAIGDDIELCYDANERINLQTETTRLGGTYSGDGVVVDDGTYYFDSEVAGLGVHLITYEIVNNFSCPSIATRSINVVRRGAVSGGSDLSLCKGGGTYSLNSHDFSPGSGIYSGAQISNNILDPNKLEPGVHEVYFSYDFRNGCVGVDTLNVTISDSDIVTFGADTIVCITSGELPLNINDGLAGGEWKNEGDKGGVLGNSFFPDIAGLGTHNLTYTKSTDQCEVVGNRTIQVVSLPETPETDFARLEGCVGETVELRAMPVGESITGVEIAWYRKGATESFAFGRSVDFDIDSTETLYFTAMNINGCESVGKGEVIVVAKGPSGEISVEKNLAFVNEPLKFELEAENAAEFRWDFGDGTNSTERNPHHYYYRPGKFAVSLTITSAAGCSGVFHLQDSVTIENNGDYFEGIQEDTTTILGTRDEFINAIDAYPNPFTDHLTIDIDLPTPEDVVIEIYDMKGTLIRRKVIEHLTPNGHVVSLDLSDGDLSNQLYMLLVKGKDYTKHIKLFKHD